MEKKIEIRTFLDSKDKTVNDFLEEKKITKENLIDIKITNLNNHYDDGSGSSSLLFLIIYEKEINN